MEKLKKKQYLRVICQKFQMWTGRMDSNVWHSSALGVYTQVVFRVNLAGRRLCCSLLSPHLQPTCWQSDPASPFSSPGCHYLCYLKSPGFLVEGDSGLPWLHPFVGCCETSLVFAEPTGYPEMGSRRAGRISGPILWAVWEPIWEPLALAPLQDS